MTQEAIDRQLDAIKRITEKALQSKVFARQLLTSRGITEKRSVASTVKKEKKKYLSK